MTTVTKTDLIERAYYDLDHLPLRQAMLRAMLREPHHTIEGLRIIRRELAENDSRIADARHLLGRVA